MAKSTVFVFFSSYFKQKIVGCWLKAIEQNIHVVLFFSAEQGGL